MKRILMAAGSLCLALLLYLGFVNTSQIRAIYPGISLRYEEPLPAKAVEKCLRGAAGGVTFWGQTAAPVHSELREAQATLLFYSGDAGLVWPNRYLQGQAPALLDGCSCAVSEQLAWELFGSTDVVGLSVTVEGVPYTICGVAAGKTRLLLAPTAKTDAFTAVELLPDADGSAPAPEVWVEEWLRTAALPVPSGQLYGSELAALAGAALWLPLVLALLPVAVQGVKAGRGRPWWYRDGAVFALLLAAAFLLPAALSHIPSWLTPTRWSDFSWWSGLGGLLQARAEQWLAVKPCAKDLLAKWCLVRQTLLLFLQLGVWEMLRCLKAGAPAAAQAGRAAETAPRLPQTSPFPGR